MLCGIARLLRSLVIRCRQIHLTIFSGYSVTSIHFVLWGSNIVVRIVLLCIIGLLLLFGGIVLLFGGIVLSSLYQPGALVLSWRID